MSYIKDLFYSNISSGDQTIVRGSEYERLSKISLQLHEELRHELDGETAKKFRELSDINDEMTSLENEENYLLGFRDGARLMIDVLTGENENLRSLIKT